MDTKVSAFEEYAIELVPEDDGTYVAVIPDLPGCMAAGDDANDAIERLRRSFDLWTEDVLADGGEVPAPSRIAEYSGKVLVRTSKALHRRLALEAVREGVSMNQLAVSALAEYLGQNCERRGLSADVAAALVELKSAVREYVVARERHGGSPSLGAYMASGASMDVLSRWRAVYTCTPQVHKGYDVPLAVCGSDVKTIDARSAEESWATTGVS